jgi:hypothetical protein
MLLFTVFSLRESKNVPLHPVFAVVRSLLAENIAQELLRLNNRSSIESVIWLMAYWTYYR